MGNIYGVAAPLAVPAVYVGSGNVNLIATVETTILTSGAIVAASPGSYYPLINATIAVSLANTLPTAMTFAFKLGAGSDVDSYAVSPNSMVLALWQLFSFTLVGVASPTAWIGAGSTINLTALVTGTNQVAVTNFSRMVVQLLRGPDTVA